MTEPATKSKKSKAVGGAVGGGLAALAVAIMIFVPIIPVSYQEAYTEMETRTEEYVVVETRSESYQVIETQTDNLVSVSDYTLEGGNYVYWSSYIESGRNVQINIRASDTINTYVMTSDEFQNYQNGDGFSTVAERRETSNARYGFTPAIDDTYFLVIYNIHDGFFGLGAKNVGIYSATETATWDENVTKYRSVDVPVTKYRDIQEPVTKYREATKNITPLDMIVGRQ